MLFLNSRARNPTATGLSMQDRSFPQKMGHSCIILGCLSIVTGLVLIVIGVISEVKKTICSLCPMNSSTCVLCCYELRNDGIRQLVDEFHRELNSMNFSIETISSTDFRLQYQNDYNSIVKCQRKTPFN